MCSLLDTIADKESRLDRLRPLPPEALSKLERYYDVENTYTSNAIVGNTLSPPIFAPCSNRKRGKEVSLDGLLYERLHATLEDYLNALQKS
jgi:hypothetical protein